MDDFSILLGGKAGFGIDRAGLLIAGIMNSLGYRIYVYRDYPSIIRGGHTFSIVRASARYVASHKNSVDILLALNQDAFDLHKDRLNRGAIIIYDEESVNIEAASRQFATIPVAVSKILKEEASPEIMRNSCMAGAMVKAAGIRWDTLEKEFKKEFKDDYAANLKIAKRGYDSAVEKMKIPELGRAGLPILSGNEALALGLIKGGLKTYISYPMTPTSPILHYLAKAADDFKLKVLHPESEISVMLMALGAAYCGDRVAVGTSGGGFCLMTEGLSFSGMAELPVVVVLGQRPGPSTGLPTYSCQTELSFALGAGQGEFLRLVVAPGDPEEAYYLAQEALNISWKYQIPSIILTDKNLGEGTYNFDLSIVPDIKEEPAALWDRKTPYKRYLDTESGISPLAFAPEKDNVIKINSYEHDESGLTTEKPDVTKKMQDKRLRKEKLLIEELSGRETVKFYGNKSSDTAVICWGSNKAPCIEAAAALGYKVIQPLYMSPFPAERMAQALNGLKKAIAVESNAGAQLVKLMNSHGLGVDGSALKYDGRPFTADELEKRLKEV